MRIEVKGDQVKAYLDGKLVQEMKYSNPKTLFAVAGRAGDDVIVKVVNGGNTPKTVALQLDGASSVGSNAKLIEISGKPSDENTLDEPTKIAPKKSEIKAGTSFSHEFPACSVTILRLKAK
jgi:alpha-L-arabinofuranosidase